MFELSVPDLYSNCANLNHRSINKRTITDYNRLGVSLQGIKQTEVMFSHARASNPGGYSARPSVCALARLYPFSVEVDISSEPWDILVMLFLQLKIARENKSNCLSRKNRFV